MKRVSNQLLVNELDSFFNLLFKLYSLQKSRGHNRARAFALAYAEALKRARISNVRVLLADLNTGTPITHITDTTLLKYFTELAVGMKIGLTKFKRVEVLIDDEKYLVKTHTF